MLKRLSSFLKKHRSFASGSSVLFSNPYDYYLDSSGSKKFSDDYYSKNVIAHRCIDMLSNGAMSIPIKVYADSGLLDVSSYPGFLKRPNPYDSFKDLLKAVYSYQLIHGNSYLLAVKDHLGDTLELYTLRPNSVKIRSDKNGLPCAYEHMRSRVYGIDSDSGKSDILHIKNFNPSQQLYGLSPMECAGYSIDQHNQASKWNYALLKNSCRPSGALILRNGNQHLTDEQYHRIKSDLQEKFSGHENAGKTMLLEADLEWKEMSFSPKDMDFIEAKNNAARDIALAFGVPSQLLGIPGDNTYSNLAEARIALWEQTILPLAHNTIDKLNSWLDGVTIELDVSNIPALAKKREEIWTRIQNADFMTINEKREAVGLQSVPGGDALVAAHDS